MMRMFTVTGKIACLMYLPPQEHVPVALLCLMTAAAVYTSLPPDKTAHCLHWTGMHKDRHPLQ